MMKNIFVILLILFPAVSSAATIALKSEQVTCRSNNVTLGDVAVITPESGEDVEPLRNLVLCPAPLPGKDRILQYSQIRDVLGERGIAIGKHTFTGSSQVVVGADRTDKTDRNSLSGNLPTNSPTDENADVEKMIRDGIATYLKQRIAKDAPWNIAVSLEPQDTAILRRYGKLKAVRGGTIPYTGKQRFELQFSETDSKTRKNMVVAIDVEVSLPSTVVVAKRALSKGAIVGPSDIGLDYVDEKMRNNRENAIMRLEDAIGREVTQSVKQGTPLTTASIQMPLLIKRNDVVTVYVRNRGITIKTIGRARQEGRFGDLIVIESYQDKKKTFTGCVTELGTVEVGPSVVQPVVVGEEKEKTGKIQQVGYDDAAFFNVDH